MKHDLPGVIKKVATFLEKKITEEQVDVLVKHLDFESMKHNRSIYWISEEEKTEEQKKNEEKHGKFFREGAVGTYKKEMSEEIMREIDEWTEKTVGDVPGLLEIFQRYSK